MRRTMLLLAGVLILACIFLGLSCANSANISQDATKSATTAVSRPSTGDSGFEFELFKQAVKKDKGENVFISPTSVYLALAMVYNGAQGTTREAMAKALQVEGITPENFNKLNSKLITDLRSPEEKVRLDIANSIWANKTIPIDPDFIKNNEEAYNAKIDSLDFNDPNSPSIINAWVKKNTQNKIDNLIEEINPQAVMVLVNAVYFKGQWTFQFDPKWNRELPFHLADGQEKKVMTMCNTKDFGYYKGQDFSAVSLPYGEGRLSMYIFLPDKGSNLDTLISNLNSKNWETWMAGFTPENVCVTLPKFKIEYKTILNDHLIAMGMGEAFNKNANFKGMSPVQIPIWIGYVIHKTYIDVNETGTEAAAATAVITFGGAMPPQPIFFTVDRPFLLAIRDNKTKEILFMGSILDPS